MKKHQLPTSTLPEGGGPHAGAFLYCRGCGESFSADRGDYFMAPDDEVMTCGATLPSGERCGLRLVLARRETRIVTVQS